MKNTSWNNLEPGQIVSFIYQSKNDDRAVRRYVIVIDPKYVRYAWSDTDSATLFNIEGLPVTPFFGEYLKLSDN